jgi:hypothetical protein
MLAAACSSPKGKEVKYTAADSAMHREWQPANQEMVAQACARLQTGDLALRTGADATSHMLRGMNQKNGTYSHCGIVVIEGGQPFVYHSIGGEDNPDAFIRRDPAALFFSPGTNEGGGAVRLALPPDAIARVVDTARLWYRQKRSFDMAFDLGTDDALYCAEFVSKAVTRAAGLPGLFSRSHLSGFEYVAVDDLYEGPGTRSICSFRFK